MLQCGSDVPMNKLLSVKAVWSVFRHPGAPKAIQIAEWKVSPLKVQWSSVYVVEKNILMCKIRQKFSINKVIRYSACPVFL